MQVPDFVFQISSANLITTNLVSIQNLKTVVVPNKVQRAGLEEEGVV